MNSDLMIYVAIIAGALFALMIVAYLIISKKNKKTNLKNIAKLTKGTKEKSFSADVFYQKVYVVFLRTPFIKRYLLKIRRRLEIINIDDEYLTRGQTAKILFNGTIIVLIFTIVILLTTKGNTMLLFILLLFELFMVETLLRRNGR